MPKELPKDRVLAFHADGKGGVLRSEVGDWHCYIDPRGPGGIVVQIGPNDRRRVKSEDFTGEAEVKAVNNFGEAVKQIRDPRSEKPTVNVRTGYRAEAYFAVDDDVTFLDIDIPSNIVGVEGTFRLRLLKEKWEPKKGPIPKKK